jgi:hypothetical protein
VEGSLVSPVFPPVKSSLIFNQEGVEHWCNDTGREKERCQGNLLP